MICKDCKKRESISKGLCDACHTKAWRKKNPDKVKAYRKKYMEEHKEERKAYSVKWRDKNRLGNNTQKVYERDNFQCTMCGMSQEQHLTLFNRKLIIHHNDENGRLSNTPNHDIDNLITVCFRCHNTLHKPRDNKEIFEGLLEQDDSEYKFPKIREILLNKKKKLGTITKAKKELAEEMGLSYHTVDHLHYERKSAYNIGLQSKEVKE